MSVPGEEEERCEGDTGGEARGEGGTGGVSVTCHGFCGRVTKEGSRRGGQVTTEVDNLRIRWSAGDVPERRSLPHPSYSRRCQLAFFLPFWMLCSGDWREWLGMVAVPFFFFFLALLSLLWITLQELRVRCVARVLECEEVYAVRCAGGVGLRCEVRCEV